VPKSTFLIEYEQLRADSPHWPRPRWQPVAFAEFPRHLTRAVIVAEDSRFWEHKGFDLIAFKEAMSYNWSEGRFALGASTISQQTVKNLFLSRSKDPLRKWHELVLTWGMERHLSKTRILELYLNVAEFGQGIYGVQAAAQTYWSVATKDLSLRQAVELAATLPSPVKNNPATRTESFERRANKILGLVTRFPGDTASDGRTQPPTAAPDRTALPNAH
jgi:monofunctional biosynthetic peptidoglycan transglycosylase